MSRASGDIPVESPVPLSDFRFVSHSGSPPVEAPDFEPNAEQPLRQAMRRQVAAKENRVVIAIIYFGE
jgi:hypothetical protein